LITYIPTCSALCSSGTMAGTHRRNAEKCGIVALRTFGATFPQQLSSGLQYAPNSTAWLLNTPCTHQSSLLFRAAYVNITNAASPSTRPLRASAAKLPHNALSLVTREMRFHPNIRHRHALAGRHAKCPCSDSAASQSSFVRDTIACASHCRGIRGSSVAGN
jgi:hypothetical protein